MRDKKRDPFFFRPRKSGCSIFEYVEGGLEVHSVPLLRQPQPATFLLAYLPALPTAEVSSQMTNQEQIQTVGVSMVSALLVQFNVKLTRAPNVYGKNTTSLPDVYVP
ncbi:hypothetical protein EVAR_27415_1 [Eumeta japonica]|uniref:Uncharacterized protein n=1 Tax=Eumeta variegata TaxID=151549 RepID=A0A4C1X4Z3_EUMVA|nr:hypothetical protein EVAR_27415_1 [Eumeta japonica]